MQESRVLRAEVFTLRIIWRRTLHAIWQRLTLLEMGRASSRKTVAGWTLEYVTLTQSIEKPMEFGPVPPSAGGLLAIDALATGGFERCLGGGVLVVGGNSGVADQHCINVSPIEPVMQYLFATQEAPQTGNR